MIDDMNVDFGSIQVHKEAIADITFAVISEIEGVSLADNNFKDRFLEFFGKKRYSGIKVLIDKDGQINIRIDVVMRYGINIPMVGRNIQESVRSAVEKTADLNIKDINVNVCGIERGNP